MVTYSCRPDRILTAEAVSGRPTVGVVLSYSYPEMNELTRDNSEIYAKIACDELDRLGANVLLVDSSADALVDGSEVLSVVDGLLFLGGGDIDRSLYGDLGVGPGNEYGVDPRADRYCIALLQDAIDRDLPILGICRGSQLLNVACGGTLIPDIVEWHIHHGPDAETLFVDETVQLEPNSRLGRLFGDRTHVDVRNGHHQAVARVGAPLRPAATAGDGIVEATEHREATWVVGIQWHPEEPSASPADRDIVFLGFVNAVRDSLHSKRS